MCARKQCTNRSWSYFAAVNSLIQSVGCIAFGVCALLMHACILTPTHPYATVNNPFSAFSSGFYLQYFHSQRNCINRGVQDWASFRNFTLGVVTSSDHVQWMFIGYTADNALWLLATILLIVAAKSRWAHITYVTIQLTVMLYDAILLILFGLDIKSYQNYFSKKGTVDPATMLTDIIVMMLISSRFVVFYIVNIFLVVRLLRTIQLLKGGPRLQSSLPTTILKNQSGWPNKEAKIDDESGPQQAKISTVVDYPDVVRHPSQVHSQVDTFDDRRLRSAQNTPQSGEVRAHSKQRRRYSPPEDYEHSSSNDDHDYDPPIAHLKAEPKRRHRKHRPGQPKIDVMNSNSDDDNGNIPPIVSALRRHSSNAEELKNQRPWSYIRPEDLPSSPNKLNKFYSQLRKKPGSLAPMEQEVDESEAGPSQPAPALPAQQRPPTGSGRDLLIAHIYENLANAVDIPRPSIGQKPGNKKSKNVRFNQVSSSLEYLETSFPLTDGDDDNDGGEVTTVNKNRRHPAARNISVRRAFRNPINRLMGGGDGSGQELCTDEFVIVNYASDPLRSPLIKCRGAAVVASSPDLLFDEASNSVQMIYSDRPAKQRKQLKMCRRQGDIGIHVPPCDGTTCAYRIPPYETSL